MWFLVEIYLPGIEPAQVRRAAARVAATTATLAARGAEVRYLGASYIPVEESCFCRFESSSIENVRRACDDSSFR